MSRPADEELAALLAGAIPACSDEVETGRRFEAEADGRMIAGRNAMTRRQQAVKPAAWPAVCNADCARGPDGWAKQVAEVVEPREASIHRRARPLDRVPEQSEPPSRSKSAPLIVPAAAAAPRGGPATPNWRGDAAPCPLFRAQHEDNPALRAWLSQSKPLSHLKSLRTILDLDRPPAARSVIAPPPSPALRGSTREPERKSPGEPAADARSEPAPIPGPDSEPIILGTSGDRAAAPVTVDPAELTRHVAFLGGTGSGKTTVALNLVEQLLLRGVPALLIDRKGDLCGYARPESWQRPLDDPALAERRERLRARLDVAVYTPGNPQGRPLSIALAPAGLGALGSFERGQVARYAAAALAGMMNYGPQNRSDQSRQAILASAIDLLAQLAPDGTVALGPLIDYIGEKDPGLVNAVGRLDLKLFDKLVNDLETLRLTRGEFLAAEGEKLDAESLLGLGRHAAPGKTRLTIISTKFLGATQDIQFWVSQLLVALGRWASQSPASAGRLQAVLLFDEADLYLPAQRQPPTKEPMEDLLRRARAAGLGLFLATQSPGDFDYKCRDNIRAWFVGRVKEPTALAKMKPMLSDCRVDVAARLPTQETGEFHLIRDGNVTSLRAAPSIMRTEQLSEQEILELAGRTRDDHRE